jgi:hypothetical protein
MTNLHIIIELHVLRVKKIGILHFYIFEVKLIILYDFNVLFCLIL